MAMLNAAEVLAKLREPGPDIQKQLYKASIAGKECVVYDPSKAPTKGGDGGLDEVVIRAENVEHYVGKGFLVERPKGKGR